MQALIAGAGIGGLATGIALRQAGLDVQVFERSRDLREIGAGLMIWPNGTRALQALGVEAKGLTVQRISFCNWRGRLLIETPVDSISERYGSEVLERFAGWVEPVPALIAATPDAAILRNDMYDRPPVRRWSRTSDDTQPGSGCLPGVGRCGRARREPQACIQFDRSVRAI